MCSTAYVHLDQNIGMYFECLSSCFESEKLIKAMITVPEQQLLPNKISTHFCPGSVHASPLDREMPSTLSLPAFPPKQKICSSAAASVAPSDVRLASSPPPLAAAAVAASSVGLFSPPVFVSPDSYRAATLLRIGLKATSLGSYAGSPGMRHSSIT